MYAVEVVVCAWPTVLACACMPATLYALDYSPWSERARWALDHHKVPYKFVHHVPMLGEPLLRWRARKSPKPKASVPLLVDDAGAYGDSWDIMLRAEEVGRGAPLFFDRAGCDRIHEMIEPALRAGRARVMIKTLDNPRALADSARAVAPAFVTPLLRPVSALGARFLAHKHDARLDSVEARDAELAVVLEGLREELRGRRYLLAERFSAADIACAGLLQLVDPIRSDHMPLLPSIRACWASPPLARRFGDLLEWRDELYAQHRFA